MDEQQMRAACARIAAEWHAGGLAGGSIYEDFAVELAKVVQAAERERIAQHFDARDMGKDAGIVAALTTLRANLKTPNV